MRIAPTHKILLICTVPLRSQGRWLHFDLAIALVSHLLEFWKLLTITVHQEPATAVRADGHLHGSVFSSQPK